MPLKPSHAALPLFVCCLLLLAARGWLFPKKLNLPAALVPLRSPAELTIYYHERRPYYFRDGDRVTGTVVERANAVLQRAGIPHRWAAMPPAQQLQLVRDGHEYCAGIGWIATDDRREFARFSAPLSQDGEFVALVRADEHRVETGMKLGTLFAHRHLTLLVKDAYTYGPEIDQMIAQLQPRTLSTPAPNDAMLRMLTEQRADYFLLAHEEADALVAGLPGDADHRVVDLTAAPRGVVRHLMFSRTVPETIVQRFDAALRELAGPDERAAP